MSDATSTSNIDDQAVTQFKVRVLLVDDQLIIVEAIRRMLSEQTDIEFHYITDPAAAVDTARLLKPTVILQDLVMPAVDGITLIREYRDDAALRHVPVIVLSAKDDPQLKAHSFSAGANDYVVKLPDRLELLARIRYHSAGYISRLQRDEALQFLRASQQNLADANIELQKLAALDSLTGIANRRRFDEVMRSEWRRGKRDQKPLSLLMCGIDCFKIFNDTFGHLAGDLCLRKTAAVLTEHLKRPADVAARYGGEEFAIVLPDTDLDGALLIAHACRAHIEQLALENPPSPCGIVTMSIGVASMVPKDGSAEGLVASAGKALYIARHDGRNKVMIADTQLEGTA
jgi:two-component system chemotaxis family response regulator WspR